MSVVKKKKTLGVVAISYNEEVDLPGFLRNVVPLVDEVIIIDDGSTDGTKRIASEFGKKVKFVVAKRQEGEYYSDQRNKGIDLATTDWLLHMDIDERVTRSLYLELSRAIQMDKYSAFRFRRLNYFLHRPMRGGGWSDWNLVHLAKRDVLRFGGMYHESIDLSIGDCQIGQLNNRMHHFNDSSYSERLRKSMTYQEEVLINLENKGVVVNSLSIVKAVVREFTVKYFYKKGFRDGTPGVISAFHSAFAMFKVYALLWDKQNCIKRKDLEYNLIDEKSL